MNLKRGYRDLEIANFGEKICLHIKRGIQKLQKGGGVYRKGGELVSMLQVPVNERCVVVKFLLIQ